MVKDEIGDWLLDYPDRAICAVNMSKPKECLTPEYLAQLWKCGLEMAKRTIEATTCKHYRHTTSKGLTKRFKPTRDFNRYRQIRFPAGEFYSDTMMSKIKSVRGHVCSQIYGNKCKVDVAAKPMENRTKMAPQTGHKARHIYEMFPLRCSMTAGQTKPAQGLLPNLHTS